MGEKTTNKYTKKLEIEFTFVDNVVLFVYFVIAIVLHDPEAIKTIGDYFLGFRKVLNLI